MPDEPSIRELAEIPAVEVISRAAVIPRVQKMGKSLFQTDPAHKLAKQYLALANEVDRRVQELRAESLRAMKGGANG